MAAAPAPVSPGGAVPQQGGIIVSLTRMNRILEIDREDRTALVEPGVINLELSEETLGHGFFSRLIHPARKPAPSAATSPRTPAGRTGLKYGVTTITFSVWRSSSPTGASSGPAAAPTGVSGYDLTGAMVGSEGMLGIVTKALVRLTPTPEATLVLLAPFADIESASHATSRIIAAGIVPAALEMMDNLTIQAVEPAYHAGYPMDAGAVLLIEIDGSDDDVRSTGEEIARICLDSGATEVRSATERSERDLLWKGRKMALGAMGRLAPELLPARHRCAPLQAAGHAAPRGGDLA